MTCIVSPYIMHRCEYPNPDNLSTPLYSPPHHPTWPHQGHPIVEESVITGQGWELSLMQRFVHLFLPFLGNLLWHWEHTWALTIFKGWVMERPMLTIGDHKHCFSGWWGPGLLLWMEFECISHHWCLFPLHLPQPCTHYVIANWSLEGFFLS